MVKTINFALLVIKKRRKYSRIPDGFVLIETKIRTRLSKAISRFLYNNDTAVEDIKKLYAFRSKAVHEYKNSEHNVLEESVDILNKLILKCIEQKALPDLGILLNSTD